MHNTGNDLESNDILDFEDNTVNLDILMNADQEYWTDRLGNKRPTIDYALRMAGFTPAGFDFTTGGVLKNGDRNKCVFNQADQTWYSWLGDLPYNVIPGTLPNENWNIVNPKIKFNTTSFLRLETVEQLVLALTFQKEIIVDSALTISSAVTIPSGAILKSGGGVIRVIDNAASIKITPNVNWFVDVSVGAFAPEPLFHIDGKIKSPVRWYVAEHTTTIKCSVKSTVTNGTCVFFDGISTASTRALISGVDVDIILSKMEYGCKVIVDRTLYDSNGPEAGSNGYITSNRIQLVGGGTPKLLHEQYSGDGTTRPAKEEIAANYYHLTHQPREGVINIPLRMVGRMQQANCSFWDSHKATNNNQIQIYGNDCKIFGPNLPALNSGYVNIVGLRCSYEGVSYGTPRARLNAIELERGCFIKAGPANISVGGVIGAAAKTLPIRGTSKIDGLEIVNKDIKILTNQLPAIIEIEYAVGMINDHPLNLNLYANGIDLVHNTLQVNDVLGKISIIVDKTTMALASTAVNDKCGISNSVFNEEEIFNFSLTVFSDSTTVDCGYLRFYKTKLYFGGI